MDPNEIIKATPELLKHGAELVGALKLTEIAKAMLGPATGEFAERVRDEIRLYRFGRQLELLKKAEKMVQDAGFTPKAVPIKLLFPLLEGASLEENEDLHTMWAALLANAALDGDMFQAEVSFTHVLRQLSPSEARMLRWIKTNPKLRLPTPQSVPHEYLKEAGLEQTHTNVDLVERSLDALESCQLVRRVFLYKKTSEGDFVADVRVPETVQVTSRGHAFLKACQPPKPKS